MNEQLKKDALILCERIRELTKQVDKKIENIDKSTSPENIKIKVEEKEKPKQKKFIVKPPAGRKGTKWDNTIIDWKSSLRSPW
jgi:hypothetical protein